MAPTFLQRLAKVTSPINGQQGRERKSSESASSKHSTPGISRNRSPSITINSSPSGSNLKASSTANITTSQASSLISKKFGTGSRNSSNQNLLEPSVPSIVTTRADGSTDKHSVVEHKGSFESTATGSSTQPNVTIIPPSPVVGYRELDSDFEDDKDENIPAVVRQPTTTETSPKPFVLPGEDIEDATPTPTLDNQKSIPSPTITTPTNTTRGKDKMASSNNNSLVPGSFLRKQSSDKSLSSKSPGKKTPRTDLQINTLPANHLRAATAPPETTSPPQQLDSGTVIPEAIVDSPTELQPPINLSDSQNGLETAPAASNVSSPKSIGIQPENASMSVLSLSSIAASEGGKGSKRPWKRSTTRKPTGLASAIAASGLSMANHTMSTTHSTQAAAQISPPLTAQTTTSQKSVKSLINGAPGSPPYLSRSPAQSSISNRSWNDRTKSPNANLSPRSIKSNKSGAGGSKRAASPGRPRRSSRGTSAKSDAGGSEYSNLATSSTFNLGSKSTSVNGDESFSRPEYFSAFELDADTSSEEMSGSDVSDEEFGEGDGLADIPVTGFAVASTRRNQDFHELFPTVPEGDYLIEDYGCALQREILIQGRIYISENHICFHANIFGWITDLSIPVYEITAVEKKMTAFVIPNAIQITTRQTKYTFTSFLARDTTFDVMHNIWRLARPEDIPGSGRGSLEGPPLVMSMGGDGAEVGPPGARGSVVPAPIVPAKRATQCWCGRDGKHYSEISMEIVIPGTPEKINNLMFASGFMKDFMLENQKLLDIQISDWTPVSPGSKLLTRNMSYIKPLAGSLGPKQTKCELKDEMAHVDFEEYISTMTTTRTPDVPSGGVFSVKTRTCVMWASPVSSKVIVSSQVEWTGRSFIKGIIEKSAVDGQRQYHVDLEKAMREYIQEHQSEFLPEGVEPAAVAVIDEAEVSETGRQSPDWREKHPTPEELKQRERERNARGLQWAWDTFDGAYQVAKRSTKGALELIRDAWDQSTSTTILWFLIVILVLSNLWTLMRMGSNKAESARKLEARKTEEREKWVQSIVTALWEEMAVGGKGGAGVLLQPTQQALTTAPTAIQKGVPTREQVPLSTMQGNIEGLKEEVKQLYDTLKTLEERAQAIRRGLGGYEKLIALD